MPTSRLKLPSQKKLLEDFAYNPETGSFIRYDGNYGFITSCGYWGIKYEGEGYKCHRLIWKWWYGCDPDEVDHTNGDRLDNRISNLKNVNHKTNTRNAKKAKNNTSGFNGITLDKNKNKWAARLNIEKRIHIGFYNTPKEAKEARDSFIEEFYPGHFTERHGT